MKLSETGLIELGMGSQGPLCPNSMQPQHPSHQVAVQMQNAAYVATPRDEDGEPLTQESAAINSAIANAYGSGDLMRLYRDAVIAQDYAGRTAGVEALYFRCLTCGLTLPASRTAR